MDFTTSQITLITACISALIALWTNAASRRNEHRLSVLKVLLEAAYKEYEFRTKADLEAAKLANKPAKIKSFTEYIIFYRELAEVFSKKKVHQADLISSLEKNKKLIDTYYENRELQRPEYHKEPQGN